MAIHFIIRKISVQMFCREETREILGRLKFVFSSFIVIAVEIIHFCILPSPVILRFKRGISTEWMREMPL